MPRRERPSSKPEEQTMLEVMGTARVLADLARKYNLPKPTIEPEVDEMGHEDRRRLEATGGRRVLDELNQRREKLMRELEHLPKHQDTYRQEEIAKVIDVERHLRTAINEFDRAAGRFVPGSPDYASLCRRYVKNVMRYLDGQDFWSYKFTTEDAGGASSNLKMTETPDDSVYYVTRSGISLRLKRSASGQGLKTVIQPFFEKIVFALPGSDLKDERPSLGTRVTEYRSDEFRALIKRGQTDGDFHSTNEIYLKAGKIFYIASNDQNPHEGDRVNRILDVRKN